MATAWIELNLKGSRRELKDLEKLPAIWTFDHV